MESTHRLERIQREHELTRAYEAARTLRERLELAGLDDAARTVKRTQNDIYVQLVDLVIDEDTHEPSRQSSLRSPMP
jgi:ribosomal protein L18